MKKRVIIGLLGTQLDRIVNVKRWSRWRPTVALFLHEDLLIDRLELLYQQRYGKLANLVRDDIQRVAPETQVNLMSIDLEDPWDFESVYAVLHDFAQSYPFDNDAEEYLLHITTGSHVAQICLFLLTEARYFPAKLLQTSPGSGDQRARGSYTIIDLDLSKYDRIAQRFQRQQQQGLSFLKAGIDTRSSVFNRLIESIEQVAIHSRAPLLLTGATGVGKTQLARRIYELKNARRQISGPFVEVNCATLKGEGAMAALFGHTRGAFTGAVKSRAGLLRSADGGMLFLDEIGELGLDEQAMLLRAIEEKRFLPMGADAEVSSNFQLIAGSNRDLSEQVQKGLFREDLLARINLWQFTLPGLAERREDIEPNLDFELDRFAHEHGARVRFNSQARAAYLHFAESSEAYWKGNFRDLGASVTRMGTLAGSGRIDLALVKEEIERLRALWHTYSTDSLLTRYLDAEQIRNVDQFDQVQLVKVIAVCLQSRSLSEAGRRLFNVSREHKKTANDADRLKKYLARFGLDWRQLMSGN